MQPEHLQACLQGPRDHVIARAGRAAAAGCCPRAARPPSARMALISPIRLRSDASSDGLQFLQPGVDPRPGRSPCLHRRGARSPRAPGSVRPPSRPTPLRDPPAGAGRHRPSAARARSGPAGAGTSGARWSTWRGVAVGRSCRPVARRIQQGIGADLRIHAKRIEGGLFLRQRLPQVEVGRIVDAAEQGAARASARRAPSRSPASCRRCWPMPSSSSSSSRRNDCALLRSGSASLDTLSSSNAARSLMPRSSSRSTRLVASACCRRCESACCAVRMLATLVSRASRCCSARAADCACWCCQ